MWYYQKQVMFLEQFYSKKGQNQKVFLFFGYDDCSFFKEYSGSFACITKDRYKGTKVISL